MERERGSREYWEKELSEYWDVSPQSPLWERPGEQNFWS